MTKTRPLTLADRVPEVGDVIAFPNGNGVVTAVYDYPMMRKEPDSADSYSRCRIQFDSERWTNTIESVACRTYISRADGGPVTVEVDE